MEVSFFIYRVKNRVVSFVATVHLYGFFCVLLFINIESYLYGFL